MIRETADLTAEMKEPEVEDLEDLALADDYATHCILLTSTLLSTCQLMPVDSPWHVYFLKLTQRVTKNQ